MTTRNEAAISPHRQSRRMEIEFEATDKTAEWLFDLVANLVHGRPDLGDAGVSMQIVREDSGNEDSAGL